MKKTAVAVLLAVLTAAAAAASSVPRIIQRNYDEPPVWVAASEALLPNGDLRADLFNPVRLKRLEENRADNPERCAIYMGSILHGTSKATVEDRVPIAYTIVAGEITAVEEGFYGGKPGKLFALRVSSRPKMRGHSTTSDLLYFFVAGAAIATPRGIFCSNESHGAIVPAVGDRIVVLSDVPAQDLNRQLMIVDPRFDFIIERGRSLLGPAKLKSGRATNLDGVLAAISRSGGLGDVPARERQ